MNDEQENKIPIRLSDDKFVSLDGMEVVNFIEPDSTKEHVYLLPNPDLPYFGIEEVIESARIFVFSWLNGEVHHPNTHHSANVLLTTAIHDSFRFKNSLRLNDIVKCYNDIIKQQFVDIMVDDGVFDEGLTSDGNVGYRWSEAGIGWRDENLPYPKTFETDK